VGCCFGECGDNCCLCQGFPDSGFSFPSVLKDYSCLEFLNGASANILRKVGLLLSVKNADFVPEMQRFYKLFYHIDLTNEQALKLFQVK